MKSTILGALLGSLALLGVTTAGAATFTPNVFDDPAPVAAPNGCTGQGSNPTRCSLREASLAANANNEPDTIVLAEGTYNLTIPEAGGPESGDLDFIEGDNNHRITIQGAGSAKTILQAGAGLGERLIQVNGLEAVVNFSGFTVTKGNSPGNGGGMSLDSGATDNPVNLTDVNFVDNQATGSGGGLALNGSSPVLLIDGGTFSENTSETFGGGIYLGTGGSSTRLLEIKNAVISGNRAEAGNGGGIYQSSAQGLSVSDSQITGNTAANPSNADFNGEGGGIYASNGGTPTAAIITNCNISDNEAAGEGNQNIGGGGFFGGSGGLFSFIGTTFSNNRTLSGRDGGGVYVSNGGGLQILSSTFSGNSGGTGGGLYHNGSGGTAKEITNSTFSGNTASVSGGGIFIDRATSDFTFNNVTIANNTSAGVGGGVTSDDFSISLLNSIFSGNNSAGFTDDCAGNFISEGFNIFGSPNNQDCEPDGQNVGTNPDDIVGDPLIGPLQDNGGPTQTHNLLAGSPALDGGNPNGCTDGEGDPLTTDQRGFIRPSGSECDIGAVEAAVTDLAIVKTADDEIYVVGDEITYTLTVTNNGPGISPARVSDVLPSEVSFVSADAGCAESGGTVTCDLGSLDPGASAAVSIVVEANSDGTVENTATVAGADIDTDPNNDSSSVTVNVLSNDTDGGGGCRIGHSPGSPASWSLFAILMAALLAIRRRWN